MCKYTGVQVSLVPHKSQTEKTKTFALSLNYAKNSCIPSLFAVYSDFLGPWIVETANTKTANFEARLYCKVFGIKGAIQFYKQNYA